MVVVEGALGFDELDQAEAYIGASWDAVRGLLGGKGANQAVMAARFGAPVAMVNAVGNDAYGSAHMENFAKEGINTTWMRSSAIQAATWARILYRSSLSNTRAAS